MQSGETVLLGGLIRETRQDGQKGVPGLSKIPLIGRLFGKTTAASQRQELLVMITPTVIDSAEAAQDMTMEYRSRFKGLKPLIRKELPADPAKEPTKAPK